MADEKTGQQEGTGKTGESEGTGKQTTNEPDFLNDPKVKAEIDRRAAQAADTREAKVRSELTRATEEAAKKAEAERLKEQGEFKQLAETHEANLKAAQEQLAALAQVKEQAKAYEELLTKNVAATITELGLDKQKHILALLKDMPIAKQAAWLTENRAELAKATGTKFPETTSERTKSTTTDPSKERVLALGQL